MYKQGYVISEIMIAILLKLKTEIEYDKTVILSLYGMVNYFHAW